MIASPSLEPGLRLSDVDLNEVMARFDRDGVAIVSGALSTEDCALLRNVTDETLDDEVRSSGHTDFWNTSVLREGAGKHPVLRDLMVREPLLSLAQAVLGSDCRYCGSVVIRNRPGTAIDTWHIDLGNHVEFPLPDEIPHHDFRMRMPVQWFTIQVALTDIEAPEFGPSQVVPGSHYSGRTVPTDTDSPTFLGQGPEYLFCRAGDIYLFNHQVWHRGSPNTSSRVRYLLQCQYAQDWAVRRFSGLHEIEESALEGADDRLLRLMMRDGSYAFPERNKQ